LKRRTDIAVCWCDPADWREAQGDRFAQAWFEVNPDPYYGDPNDAVDPEICRTYWELRDRPRCLMLMFFKPRLSQTANSECIG
jgi:hypothetical protein